MMRSPTRPTEEDAMLHRPRELKRRHARINSSDSDYGEVITAGTSTSLAPILREASPPMASMQRPPTRGRYRNSALNATRAQGIRGSIAKTTAAPTRTFPPVVQTVPPPMAYAPTIFPVEGTFYASHESRAPTSRSFYPIPPQNIAINMENSVQPPVHSVWVSQLDAIIAELREVVVHLDPTMTSIPINRNYATGVENDNQFEDGTYDPFVTANLVGRKVYLTPQGYVYGEEALKHPLRGAPTAYRLRFPNGMSHDDLTRLILSLEKERDIYRAWALEAEETIRWERYAAQLNIFTHGGGPSQTNSGTALNGFRTPSPNDDWFRYVQDYDRFTQYVYEWLDPRSQTLYHDWFRTNSLKNLFYRIFGGGRYQIIDLEAQVVRRNIGE